MSPKVKDFDTRELRIMQEWKEAFEAAHGYAPSREDSEDFDDLDAEEQMGELACLDEILNGGE